MSKLTTEQIEAAFSKVGENNFEEIRGAMHPLDLEKGKPEFLMCIGFDPAFQPQPKIAARPIIKFADQHGIIWYEAGTIMKRMVEEGLITENSMYKVTFIGDKTGAKGVYKMYDVAVVKFKDDAQENPKKSPESEA